MTNTFDETTLWRNQSPRIYVVCCDTYDRGLIHGGWIKIGTKTIGRIQHDIENLMARSPTPGAVLWAIHDSIGLGRTVAEYSSIKHIYRLAQGVAAHGSAFLEFVAIRTKKIPAEYVTEHDIQSCLDDFADNFLGHRDGKNHFMPAQYQAAVALA